MLGAILPHPLEQHQAERPVGNASALVLQTCWEYESQGHLESTLAECVEAYQPQRFYMSVTSKIVTMSW